MLSEGNAWHIRAAKMSWILFVIGFIVNFSSGESGSHPNVVVGVGVFICVLFLLGLFSAIWAIVGAFTKGPKIILVHAAVGLFLNGWVVHLAYRTYQSTQLVIEQHRAEDHLAISNTWVPTDKGWHVDRKDLFAIRFPETWSVKEQPNLKVAVAAFSPTKSNSIGASELLTVSVNRVWPSRDPASILARELDVLSKADGYEKCDTGQKTINGVEWSWVTYRLPISGVDSLVTSFLVIRNMRLYVVSKIVLFEDPDARMNEIEESINSVIIPEAK